MPLYLWLGYVFFVVYGSLVPLQYKGLPFSEAWQAFQNIPYLKLGIESRADWVANGVLYVPVGFLTTYVLAANGRRIWSPVAHLIAATFCGVLAISVEFTQLYFPPRTVSLNDVVAELIGSAIGIFAAARFGQWFAAFLHSFLNDTKRLLVLGLDGYVVAYLAFAMFPFDFLVSTGELSEKMRSVNWGWLYAGEGQRATIQLVKLMAEVVLTVPFGILLARFAGHKGAGYTLAVFFGLFLGSAVEIAQFFIASGVSQGLSVLSRVAGVVAGVGLYSYATGQTRNFTWDAAGALVRRLTLWLAIPYLVVLLEITGWFTTRWQGLAAAKVQLEGVNFMPFYYHYYTTEAIALFSLAAVALSYVPVGVSVWGGKRPAGLALAGAALLAGVLETGKLFISGAHPDPTNVLIAGFSAWATAKLLMLFSSGKQVGQPPLSGVSGAAQTSLGRKDTSATALSAAVKSPGTLSWLGLLVCLTGVAAWVEAFPSFRLLVAAVLLASCVAVWFQPRLVFAIIPAALPIFDLAPWSGRFFFDEFDALVVVTLAVAYVRGGAHDPAPGPDTTRRRTAHKAGARPDLLVLGVASLLALSFAISTVRGLMPFSWPDANAFNNYFSTFNALRIAKGALWAGLIWHLSGRFFERGADVRRQFSWGIAAGLAITVAWIIWERVAFPGLLNFTEYRVTGPFSATHTGGAYVDCFLAAAIPFLIVLTVEQRYWPFKLVGGLLVLASTYALAVTYSRGGYLAFAVAVSVVLLALLFRSARKLRVGLVVAGLAAAMLVVALPVFKSGFMQSRLASVAADFEFRKAHWSDALDIREPDLFTSLFGMGLGRFPDTKYWRSNLHPKIATYQLKTEKQGGKDNTFIRLDAGEAIGVEQWVVIEPGQIYVLKFDVRPSHASTKVTVPICEKWLLTSARCIEPGVDLGALKGAWRSVEVKVDTQALAPASWPLRRPIKLALTHGVAQSTIDVDNLRLLGPDGNNLLSNGDFSRGLDHWFFSISGTLHAHWRTHNLFVGVLFDQGWLGLVATLALLGVAAIRGAKAAWRGDILAAAALAALCGFIAGALLDTQIDAPRFVLLLLLLVWACVRPGSGPNSTYHQRKQTQAPPAKDTN